MITRNYSFPVGTVEAIEEFARARPWRGTVDERREKITALHSRLCTAYNVKLSLVFDGLNQDDVFSGESRCDSEQIVMNGRLSAITYLFLFALSGTVDRVKAMKFAANLFQRGMPRSFARLLLTPRGVVSR